MELSSRERVEDLARQARERSEVVAQEAKQVRDAQDAERAQDRAFELASIRKLHKCLVTLSDDLRKQVGIFVEFHAAPEQTPTVVLAISTLPPWAQRPYLRVRITAKRSKDDAARVLYTVHPFVNNGQASRTVTEDALIAEVEQACAAFINDKATFAYHVPDWYPVAGNVIAWPLGNLCKTPGGPLLLEAA